VLARRDRTIALAIVLFHAVASCLVLASGFSHVSDDDFARVTIAQTFAHAPRLDPSGTSWLPFPFWWTGIAMALFGRSLAVARVASIALAAMSTGLVFAALRSAGVSRGRALAGVAFAALSPWPLWLGAATVPELFTAMAAAAGIVALAHRPSYAFAGVLALASLSRYEAWPIAAAAAIHLAWSARRASDLGRHLAIAILAAAAPLGWMAWNAWAHGSALHFFHRVSTFKRSIGEGSTDLAAALLFYPRLLVTARPELAIGTLAGLAALRDPEMRRRWLLPIGALVAQLVFLAIGNARDGAPAHHPERALIGAMVIAALFAVDGCAHVASRLGRRTAAAALALVAGVWAWSSLRVASDVPGSSPAEDRSAQIARGTELRERGAPPITVEPCAFEHFALLAAYGAPERATIRPRSGAPASAACPRVSVH
jgi:hypothetical protein